jgi:hypothetical protein
LFPEISLGLEGLGARTVGSGVVDVGLSELGATEDGELDVGAWELGAVELGDDVDRLGVVACVVGATLVGADVDGADDDGATDTGVPTDGEDTVGAGGAVGAWLDCVGVAEVAEPDTHSTVPTCKFVQSIPVFNSLIVSTSIPFADAISKQVSPLTIVCDNPHVIVGKLP